MRNRLQSTTTGVLVLFLMLAASGCRTFRVQSDWDADIDFSAFQKFYWQEPQAIEGADPFADNSLLRKRVRRAVALVMADRGFIEVDTPEQAELWLTFRVLLDHRLKVDGLSTSIEGGLYRRRGDLGTGYATTDIRSYQESTLMLDILSPDSGDLLWRGWGRGLIRTRDRDRDEKRLRKGIRAILDEYPPNPAG